MASEGGYHEVVKLLLADIRVKPYASDSDAIIQASINGYYEVVKLLLADGRANPSARFNIAIRSASRNGYYEVVKLLLADWRISIETKIKALFTMAELHPQSSLIPVFDIKRVKYLASLSLQDLINHGNTSEYDRKIILSKFFWWFRLNKLYGITTSKTKDPFIKSLLLEQS